MESKDRNWNWLLWFLLVSDIPGIGRKLHLQLVTLRSCTSSRGDLQFMIVLLVCLRTQSNGLLDFVMCVVEFLVLKMILTSSSWGCILYWHATGIVRKLRARFEIE